MAQTPQPAQDDHEPYDLTSGQVADRLGVDPSTVSRWSAAGALHCSKTLGGHRRYRRADVERFASEQLGQGSAA